MTRRLIGTVLLRGCLGLACAASGYWLSSFTAHDRELGDSYKAESHRLRPQSLSTHSSNVASESNRRNFTLAELRYLTTEPQQWLRNTERITMIRSVFSEVSRTSGASHAISEACQLFIASKLPLPLRDRAIEVAAISALDMSKASKAELVESLKSYHQALTPLIKAFAHTVEPRTPSQIYLRISTLLSESGVEMTPEVQKVVLTSAIVGTEKLEVSELAALYTLAGGDDRRDELLQTIVTATAEMDAHLASVFLAQQTETGPTTLIRVFRSMRLPPEAFGTFYKMLQPDGRIQFISEYVKGLCAKSPQHFSDLAKLIRPDELPEETRSLFIRGLLGNSGGSVFQWLASSPEPERAAILNHAYQFLTTGQEGMTWNFNLAREWLAAAAPCKGVDQEHVERAIQYVAGRAPLDTALFYTKLLAPEKRDGVERYIYFQQLYEMAGKAASSTLLSFVDSAPPHLRKELLDEVARYTGAWSPDVAMKWHSETTDADLKAKLEEGMMQSSNISQLPIETRKTWITERLRAPRFLNSESEAVNTYVGDLLDTDPKAAVDFLKSLPESALRNGAIKHLARNWAHYDPVSASEWIVELPPGASRDQALSQLIKSSRDDMESAFANASAISEQQLRLQTTTVVVEWWKSRDPARVRSELLRSSLPEEEKKILFDLLSK